jgi:hypothetical protein
MLREKCLKVSKWLETNKEHPDYEKGLKWLKTTLDLKDLWGWYFMEDIDFEVLMEAKHYGNDLDKIQTKKEIPQTKPKGLRLTSQETG